MKGILSLRGFRKLRTGAIVATGVFLFATSNVQLVQASEEDGVWEARTVEQVKADIASLAKDSNYVIKWGDTLSVISEATGISMDALAQMNQITNINLIYAHNELGFTQPISTTTGNQTVSKQTVTVVNRQNKQEEVKAFEVTTKEDTQSGKTETVVTEVKPTTKEEKTAPKTEQAPVVTTKEETSKVNQTLVSSQPAEKTATIGKKETAKVDQTSTAGKVKKKKTEQAPAVVNPTETSVKPESKESTPSKPVEEKKKTEGTTPKETTEEKVDNKKVTSP
ncbi:MAG: LysM peptidoglycan-binding domain-containing protein, partial [Granulicatella sp.]|nr:LysM peptidoglycan-binding domain-containing protein [Granulicatella sp.]